MLVLHSIAIICDLQSTRYNAKVTETQRHAKGSDCSTHVSYRFDIPDFDKLVIASCGDVTRVLRPCNIADALCMAYQSYR
jgi:hypothetical protein